MEQLKLDYDSGEIKTKVEIALDRIKTFEPKEGYYVAFSGGKDSLVVYHLCKMAGVKFDTHYAHTTVDPPELICFIRENYPDIDVIKPKMSMWQLIEHKKMPPTRGMRYCCTYLKEEGGTGRFVITGVRHEESSARSKRNSIEFDVYGSQSKEAIDKRDKFYLMNDNDRKRNMIESCVINGKNILNPIIDWTEKEVWHFLKNNNIKYCKLYDEGFKRLGCIGCPMAGDGRIEQFKKYPKYYLNYKRAFKRMLENRKKAKLKTKWKNENSVMKWWLEIDNKKEFERVEKQILGGKDENN